MLPARLAAPGEPGQTSDFPQRGASRLPLLRATHAGLEIAAKTALNGAGRAPDRCSARTAPGAVGADPRCGEAKGRVWAGGCPDTSPGLSKATREGFGVAPPLPEPHSSLVSLPCSAAGAPSTLWHPAGTALPPGLGAAAAFPASPRQPHQKQRAEREGKSQLRLPKEQEKHREEPSLALLFPHATNKQSTKCGKQPRAALGTKWVLRPRKHSSGARILWCVKGDRDLSGWLWREAG